jgi:hypothetical protein
MKHIWNRNEARKENGWSNSSNQDFCSRIKKIPRGLGIPGYRGNWEILTVYRANSKREFWIQIFLDVLNKSVSKTLTVFSL